jgi:hypothetical protein
MIPACSAGQMPGTTPVPPPTSGSVPGATTLKAVLLSGRQEVPPTPSSASGSATVALNDTHTTLTVTVSVSGLTNISEADLHAGPIGVNGPILFSLASGPFGSPLVVTLSEAALQPSPAQGIVSFADAVNALFAGRLYINIHTTAFPDGEIRGQVGSVTLHANLGAAEPAPSLQAAATATLELQINNDQSIISFTLNVSGTTGVTGAHIHARTQELLFNLSSGPIPAQLTGTLTSANFTPTTGPGFTTFDEAVDAMISGNTFADVHLLTNPPGVIQGRILP